ncbi:MAG: ABC transporter substrate-binding protein [Sphingomonas sp. 28-66-16]|nr:MAG: ABC transporter substrate-binding protein [Sphingomonas sp. 28-66-16]
MIRLAALLLATSLLAGCDRRSDVGPVVVSAIGKPPSLAEAGRAPKGASRLLIGATAQGLVSFDSSGQIIPGLAERWIVIDDGMSYIFRLREAEWSNGAKVTAGEVTAILRRQLAPSARHPLAPFLTAIDEVVEMTPEVIEVRLRHPRPDLLKLFAQPELAIYRTRPPGGTGPFRIAQTAASGMLLKPSFDPVRAAADEVEEPGPEQSVQLIGERASRAIVRFIERKSDLVSGGSFSDWPLVASAGIAPANLRVDPAVGLFGLAIANREGFLADSQNRAAIAQAIDRSALVAAFAPGWEPVDQILPDQLDSAAPPAAPAWKTLSPDDRRAGARARVIRWSSDHRDPVTLRIALPAGPGATILFGFVGAALRSIGIEPRRVAIGDDADLRLVDEVAPYDSARWYLASACAPCSDTARAKLEAAREAPDLTTRAAAIAEADAAINDEVAFIPLARPLRWSLVALRLRQWQTNVRAVHPLNLLRSDPK